LHLDGDFGPLSALHTDTRRIAQILGGLHKNAVLAAERCLIRERLLRPPPIAEDQDGTAAETNY
jgi:hypothetical protein